MQRKIEIAPGVIKDDTDLAAEGSWTNSDGIRFVRGRPQVGDRADPSSLAGRAAPV